MNPLPLDIHTHRLPAVAGTAIISTGPEAFAPQPGMYYSVGLHPWHLERYAWREPDFRARLAAVIAHPQVLAVGEAGLDKLAAVSLAEQTEAFRLQALLAEEAGKPLVVHLVRATAELLALRRERVPRVPWVVHGFRGKAQLAAELVRHGLCLSFGEHWQPDALRAVPAERLFLETDESPVAPETLLARMAAVREVPAEALRAALAANVARCFGAPGGLFFS